MRAVGHVSTFRRNACQAGAVLITGLVFLIVLMMLGVTAARIATLEGHMAGNMRDRSLALQAADMALRDAEIDIQTRIARLDFTDSFAPNCNADGLDNSGDDGLCYNGLAGYPTPVWTTVSMLAGPSVAYGSYTNAAPIDCASTQSQDCISTPPRYIIEAIQGTVAAGCSMASPVCFYRITARAQGKNPTTWVMLQEVYQFQ